MPDIQEQLHELNRLALKELRKGADRDKDLVAELQRQSEILGAQIQWQTSGEVQHHGSDAVLSSITCPRFNMSHSACTRHVVIIRPHGRLGRG